MATHPEATDRRVRFDFEIDFTNGGGIQGQDFRLDIDSDDISDRELAEHIVRDLRLLMVGEVRILNKEILRERHKRSARADPRGEGADGRARIDLSHPIADGTETYPGLPTPTIGEVLTREQSRDRYAPGTEFQIGSITLCGNTGTYVDSPFHRYADGTDLAALPLDGLADLDAVRIDVTGSTGRAITRAHLLPYDVTDRAVLLHTGWARHWGTGHYADGTHPFLTGGAADHLVDQRARLVGIDALNIDDTSDGQRPVHTALLGAGIPVCEHLTNLERLPVEGFRFSAVPAPIRGMGTFPVRAYAVLG
ncbi:cyclase family protein [Egibacter rhizosphaerae]|uniref:cyclase family protein n=1 Tax=Egibacter rhizosphaerae TaxID=1670831 RepID=UPI00197AF66C|nr:cyclase family protein [Egibacter rhizosphaerae]